MIRKLFLLGLLIFFLQSTSFTQVGRLSGSVLDKSTQRPLPGASIVLASTPLGTIADSAGLFSIGNIPVKSYNIEISRVGYKSYVLYNMSINTGNEMTLNIELEPLASQLGEVTVTSNRRTVRAATLETPLSVQRLTTEEIKSNPGGNFDISKVIQALPGVGGGVGGGGFRNDIIIRGGAPNENVFYLDGIEIPVINHFQTQGSSGGPLGLLNVSFIEDVKLSTSAFDARYDNAMSSVFQFKQKNGNPNHLQGNIRLSATELAATFDGPLSRDKKTTFLASARRSYLQFLFSLIDIPIRPNFWDFQTKITRQLSKKTTVSFIGLGAIDEFSFGTIKEITPEKQYIFNSNPLINQWNYTVGASLKQLLDNGFLNISLSRNTFNNQIDRFEDNEAKIELQRTLKLHSAEIENKLRLDVNKNINGWKMAYGAALQWVQYNNNTYNVLRKPLIDAGGTIYQPALTVNFKSPLGGFLKTGLFVQAGRRLMDNRVGVSLGLRADGNSFTTEGMNLLSTLSPRASITYVIANNWNLNASAGRYYKLPPYTILGYATNANVLVNKGADYLRSDHLAAGFEYVPAADKRFTIEAFYKKYAGVPVSARDGVALSNLGSDFNVLGNEAVVTNGEGKAYGIELFAQKKLTARFFGIFSYTFYRSLYNGAGQAMIPSSWDNKHLLSLTWGYKFKRNWELGLKFRYQGAAPFTPYNENLSRLNYLTLGQGIFDYSRINSLRLTPFHSSDVRIDKKWNFKKVTLDVFLDVVNWYGAVSAAVPNYTFKRTNDNSGFLTTDGLAIKANGSNAIPLFLNNDDKTSTPSIGVIVEF